MFWHRHQAWLTLVAVLVFTFLLLPVACQTTPNKPAAVAPATAAAAASPQANPDTFSGLLYFIEQTTRDQNLLRYDVATEKTQLLFQAPVNGWIAQAIAAPDGRQIVMAYAPPPPEGQIQFGYTNLYLMPTVGEAEPQPLFERDDPKEILGSPVWSADGRYIYYSHIRPDDTSPVGYSLILERMELAKGVVEEIAKNAVWPRLSPDGQKLAYALLNLETRTRDLYLANADGTGAALIVSSADFIDLDAPLFSPDGAWLYFSAVTQDQPPSTSWLDRLLGVQSAAAHSVPSDWWRLSLTGGVEGAPERLTQINETGMYGVFSPDGRVFAFSSVTGLYVMNPDGTNLSKLLEISAADSLSWVP